MKKILLISAAALAAFLLVVALAAGFAWASGFNFDHRGPRVGEAFYFASCFGIAAAFAAGAAVGALLETKTQPHARKN